MVSRALLTFLSFTSMCLPVLAHPGHGTTSPDSPAHYVIEPVHSQWLIALLVAAAAGAAVWQLRRLQKQSAVKSGHSLRDRK